MSTQHIELLTDQGKELRSPKLTNDGVYKVRMGAHKEKLIQVRASLDGEWRRFTSEDEKLIVFVRV